VCEPELVLPPAPPAGRARAAPAPPGRTGARAAPATLDAPALEAAILGVVRGATPPVGRTRAVEILRGGRSKVIAQYSYDALREYGAFAHLHAADVMRRVDAMLQAGSLHSTGGRFPKLTAA
jgi:ATP-dependent DNA helicase RecQ